MPSQTPLPLKSREAASFNNPPDASSYYQLAGTASKIGSVAETSGGAQYPAFSFSQEWAALASSGYSAAPGTSLLSSSSSMIHPSSANSEGWWNPVITDDAYFDETNVAEYQPETGPVELVPVPRIFYRQIRAKAETAGSGQAFKRTKTYLVVKEERYGGVDIWQPLSSETKVLGVATISLPAGVGAKSKVSFRPSANVAWEGAFATPDEVKVSEPSTAAQALTLEPKVSAAHASFPRRGAWIRLVPVEITSHTTTWYKIRPADAKHPDWARQQFERPINEEPSGFATSPVQELKIAQWDNVIGDDAPIFDPDKLKEDPDAFFVRISGLPNPPNGTNYKAKIWTNQDSGAEVELFRIGVTDKYQSKGLNLVSNLEDDVQPIASVADGTLNDQTFRIHIGEKVKIKILLGSSNEAYPIPDMEIPVPVKKTLNAIGYILRETGITGSSPVTSVPKADQQMARAKQLLAQVGVKLNYKNSIVANNPPGVLFGNIGGDFKVPVLVYDPPNPPNPPIPPILYFTDESLALFNAANLPVSDIPGNITLYYVSSFSNVGSRALSLVPKTLSSSDTKYNNRILIDVQGMTRNSVGHELLHMLLNSVHDSYFQDFSVEFEQKRNLWYGGDGWFDEIKAINVRTRINDAMYHQILYPLP